jgi:hypothetical protein
VATIGFTIFRLFSVSYERDLEEMFKK